MRADPLSPKSLFQHAVQYRVPMFQRPYVWNEEDQWQPLWDDVVRLAEQQLGDLDREVTPHFLGAIVLEQEPRSMRDVELWSVVDGQQRLTTLQVMLDAAATVVEEHGGDQAREMLNAAILNASSYSEVDPDRIYKVWPTTRDQEAFRAAMDDATTVPANLVDKPIVKAHAFFAEKARAWVEGRPGTTRDRSLALVIAMLNGLRVVSIYLDSNDNAQVIFESLNHRGTPLLASDLIKNFVFQQASRQRINPQRLYDTTWAELDADHWRDEVRQGRLRRPRIDVFVMYWLVMKLGREIASDRIYTAFRDYARNSGADIATLGKELADDARLYRSFDRLPPTSVPGRFSYRVGQALDQAVFTPVFLWLMRESNGVPEAQRDKALQTLESYLVRRALLRLTTANYNNLVLDLLAVLNSVDPATAGDALAAALVSEPSASRLWPDDASVRRELAVQQVYQAQRSSRLRMVLEALEDELRGRALSEGQECPRNLSIEHVMPQSWQDQWPLGDDSSTTDDERSRRVQRLGNLTLVSGKANSALSNRPWLVEAGEGKSDQLAEHSTLKLNAALLRAHPTKWTDDAIDARTGALTERILAIWTRPAGGLSTLDVLGRTSADEPGDRRAGQLTFVVLWNPALFPWDRRYGLRTQIQAGNEAIERWSVGGRRGGVRPGDRIVMLAMGDGPMGVVATGTARSAVYAADGWREPGATAMWVDVAFDTILEPDELLSIEALKQAWPDHAWNFRSGGALPDETASALEQAWFVHEPTQACREARMTAVRARLDERVSWYNERLPDIGPYVGRLGSVHSERNAAVLLSTPEAATSYACLEAFLRLADVGDCWSFKVFATRNWLPEGQKRRTTIWLGGLHAFSLVHDERTGQLNGWRIGMEDGDLVGKIAGWEFEPQDTRRHWLVKGDRLDDLLLVLNDPWLAKLVCQAIGITLARNPRRIEKNHNDSAAQWLAPEVGGSAAPVWEPEAIESGDWYVSFGDGDERNWEDARDYGFVSAGGGQWYSTTIRKLPVGARVWACIPGSGYVGTGVTTGPAVQFDNVQVTVDGELRWLHNLDLRAAYRHEAGTGDQAEYVVPVAWDVTVPRSEAYWRPGMFANQNSACRLDNQPETLEKVRERFSNQR